MSNSSILSDESIKEIDHWVGKYPAGKQKSAVCAAIKIVQEESGGHISDDQLALIAKHLQMSTIEVVEVASFYDMVERKPIGQYKISICSNVSCMLCGSDKITDHIESRLGIKLGETTSDGLFTLRRAECLAACAGAPMLQVNDREYYEHLTIEKVDELLDRLTAQAKETA